MTLTPTLVVRPAQKADTDAVCRLFGALHAHNATLDAHFALADGWQQVLKAER
jgi:hypothetical protein